MTRESTFSPPSAPWRGVLRNLSSAPAEWDGLLARVMIPGELSVAEGFSGSVGARCLPGGGVLADLALPALSVSHRPQHIAQPEEPALLIHLVLSGSGEFAQQGKCFEFRAGDITFRRADWPSTLRLPAPARCLTLRLPSWRWQGYCVAQGPGVARRDQPLARLIHQLARQCWPVFLAERADAALEQSLVLLLGAAYGQLQARIGLAPTTGAGVRWARVLAYIDSDLGNEQLSPASCAAQMGISVRYLHQLCASEQQRFSQLLLSRRLERAAAKLQQARLARYGIAAIAYRCGFKSPAHFSRCFRARFGLSPSVWRARQAEG